MTNTFSRWQVLFHFAALASVAVSVACWSITENTSWLLATMVLPLAWLTASIIRVLVQTSHPDGGWISAKQSMPSKMPYSSAEMCIPSTPATARQVHASDASSFYSTLLAGESSSLKNIPTPIPRIYGSWPVESGFREQLRSPSSIDTYLWYDEIGKERIPIPVSKARRCLYCGSPVTADINCKNCGAPSGSSKK